VRFTRAATRHRVSRDRIRHVIANFRLRFEEPPPEGGRIHANRIVYLGEDAHGQALEVMAVETDNREMLVIHAMPLRNKYKKKYEQEAE
jgi:hypothetical protein